MKKIKKESILIGGEVDVEKYYTHKGWISDILKNGGKDYTEYIYECHSADEPVLLKVNYIKDDVRYRVDKFEYNYNGDNILIRTHLILPDRDTTEIASMRYDNFGNVVYKEILKYTPKKQIIKERYLYNDEGTNKIMTVINESAIIHHQYLPNGKLLRNLSDTVDQVYGYNDNDLLVSVISTSIPNGDVLCEHQYEYNENDKLVKKSILSPTRNDIYEYTYNDEGYIDTLIRNGLLKEYKYEYL